MKKIWILSVLMFSMLSCKTQKELKNNITNDYTNEWQEIEENIKKGFPEKAILGLDALISMARENKDEISATQAILRKLNLKNLDQEDFMKKQMSYLKTELRNTEDTVAKSFMNYTLAQIYHNYWDSNRSVIPADMSGDDEWSGKEYMNAIDSLFHEVLSEDNKVLKIKDISQFFVNDKYEESTTLWDYFMAERIQLYKRKTYETLLGEATVRVLIENSYKTFIAKLKMQKQERIALETEIEYFNYLEKDLTQLKGKFSTAYEFIYNYHIGLKHYQEAQKFADKALKSQALLKSMELFRIVETSNDTIYANNALAEIDKILQKNLQVSTELVVIPNQPSLVYINTNNLQQVYIKVYRLSESDYLEDRREKGFPYKNRTIVHEETITLPEAKYNFVEQSTELAIPALAPGFYGIVVNTTDNFEISSENPLYQNSFLVSNLSINHYLDSKRNEMVLECIDRTTGKVIYNADFKVYERRWNASRGQLLATIYEGKGSPRFTYTPNPNKNLSPFVKFGESYFYLKNGLSRNYYSNPPALATNLITDRGIYRPGQEVHFQGVLFFYSQEKDPQLVERTQVNVVVQDNFGTEVGKLKMTTDMFGAFSGDFKIPDNLQNGSLNFRVSTSNNKQISGYKSVRVEEYKRPKYEVTFEEMVQKIELGENIQVKASAISFTGVPVVKSKVKYKVYRDYWIPYFYSRYRSYFPNKERELITSGEGVTNQDGVFEFEFLAEESIVDKSKSYNFIVELEVIDNTGETIASEKSFRISDQSLYLKFDKIKGDTYKIESVNSENIGLSATVDLIVYAKRDSEYKVERYWSFPDTSIVDQMQFSQLTFQELEDSYTDEVYRATLDVNESVELNLKDIIGTGDFKIELKSKGAMPINEYFNIIDFNTGEFDGSMLFFTSEVNEKYQPGDNVILNIGTSEEALQMHIATYKNQKLVSEKWHSVEGQISVPYSVKDSDYGGFTIMIRAFYKNRIVQKAIDINIPREHKELFIKPTSIRLVTEPGAPEKWTFVVTDKDGNPVKSRVLSSMYDASLDQFAPNQWSWNPYMNYTGAPYFQNYSFGNQFLYTSNYKWNQVEHRYRPWIKFPNFKYNPQQFYGRPMMTRSRKMLGVPSVENESVSIERSENKMELDAVMIRGDGAPGNQFAQASPPPPPPPAVRTNLSELVFFYPNLETDGNGEVSIEFTNNEALSKWHFQNFAITEDLKYGFFSEEIITKKELMIQANQPRFLRAGDKISLSAKVINLSDKNQIVKADLSIVDAINKKSVTVTNENGRIEMEAGEQAEVFWELEVPTDIHIAKLTYSVIGEKHTDAEQHIVPVMPGDIYLIESKTVLLDGGSTSLVDILKMRSGGKRTDAITIESTGSPAWYAMRSLPYLMEQDKENAEAVFNRYFANALGLKILDENPMVEKFYKEWKEKGDLKSQLNMNEELKNIDLEETPWLSNAISEEEVMQKMAELFQRGRIEFELVAAAQKLKNMQLGNGSFPWFQGGRSNYYISQYVLEGMIKLEELGISGFDNNTKDRLFRYCASEAQKVYDIKDDHISSMVIKNVWISSMMNRTADPSHKSFVEKMKKRLKVKWYEYNLHNQIYISSIFLNEDPVFATEVASSLLEKSFYKEQLGRFWNSNSQRIFSSWDISLQADMISLFNRLGKYDSEIDEMKFWLVTNKRTHSWSSPIATSAAIYALTLGKTSSFASGDPIVVKIDQQLVIDEASVGMNYQEERITDPEKLSNVKEVSFENPNENKGWANVHHQFFQDYDDIVRTENEYFDLKKEIYKIGAGDELVNVDGKVLQLGDRIRVRLIVNTDRPMQFVHIKDDRPAGAEPADLASGYNWMGRLGYYKSIKDIATHFFIDNLAKGRHVVEYDMFINNLGEFNAGVAQIQNLYAPEFNDYSKSVKIEVK